MSSRPVVSGHKNPLHFGLPERLRRTREAAGLAARQVGRVAGVDDQTILNIEGGARGKAPRVDTVEAIARALGVEACWLAWGLQGRERFRLRVPGGAPQDGPPVAQEAAQGPLTCASLPTRLTTAREARSLTQRALARVADLSHTAIANIEAGRAVPGVDVVESLAGALSVSPCWLAYAVGAGVEQA